MFEDLDIALDKNWTVGIIGGNNPLAGKLFHYSNSSIEIDLEFSNGFGCISCSGNAVNFTYEYLTDSTFKIDISDGDYIPSAWGNFMPVPLNEVINDTGVITFSSGEVSQVKIKTYSNNNVGTNRTFSLVTEEE